jgi:uncharacterized protein YndB with AHSA1/START domain
VIAYATEVAAAPDHVWPLLAQPARWPAWAPHLRGARGLGDPEVEAGRRGTVTLAPGIPIPVRILSLTPGEAWTWQAGPMRLTHALRPIDDARSEVRIELRAPLLLEAALGATYGPVIRLMLANLARVGARHSATANVPAQQGRDMRA